jgi:hypothetical protein
MNYFDFIKLPIGLARGLVITDGRTPRSVVVCYVAPDSNVRHKVVVKATANGSELWVSTFHRTKPRQTRALLARGRVLKTHD